MNLQNIRDNIISVNTENELIVYIRSNQTALENFFVSLSDDEIEDQKFELKDTCEYFINSTIFKNIKQNAEIVELLTLFASLFEKIGFYGAISLIQNQFPQESSIRLRLNAVNSFARISNVKTDYIEKFYPILDKLQKAQDFAEVDYTGQVIQDTINYYLRGKTALENGNFTEELDAFKTLFNSPNSKLTYKFLNHPNLKEYLDGYISEKIFIELIANKIYAPSTLTQIIFQELIVNQVNAKNYLTEYKSDEIRADVLNYGRADFTQPYKNLMPYDRVQLYCYFNMRKHFYTSYAIYEKIYTSLNANVFQKNRDFTFIDFGCGALTSGLAIASLYQDNENKSLKINYLGIDIAESMLEKAKEFSKTELFDIQSLFYFYTSWELIEDNFIENLTKNNAFIIFNASYLFASSSLNENSLANFVNKITSKLDKNAYFIFQNPDRADRNEKYQSFKKQISFKVEASETQKIYYKNNASSTFEPSNETVNFEILSL
jgi:hypothetical protein